LRIKLKVWRTRKVDLLSKGLEQLDEYLWLVIFITEGERSHRRDNALEIEERLKTEIQTTPMGRSITVIRA
jgi:hypothetical protein